MITVYEVHKANDMEGRSHRTVCRTIDEALAHRVAETIGDGWGHPAPIRTFTVCETFEEVQGEVKELDPEYAEYRRLQAKFGRY